ncbi:nuclear transport factor 2 family protein [Stenotrophomonas acidaminiphila]|uniref:nuclear transport factor 2 family protein n=1 Tax=Stenotrophomonas acidaminiphila TaxID=128780 RepID=UPI0028AD5B91|nr:nuclear transport factor 2 family protein [Stenotrophomonas acidaminiphila]
MRIVFIACLVACLSACGGTASLENPIANAVAAPSAAADTLGAENKAVVDRYLQAYLRGDADAMAPLLADDYVGYGLGLSDLSDKEKTLESVRKHWEVYKYQGKRYQRVQAMAVTTTQRGGRGRPVGDWVFEWGDMYTDYPADEERGGPATTVGFAYHAVFLVEHGKIKSSTIYFNHEDIMRQLGYKMIAPREQRKPQAAGLTIK